MADGEVTTVAVGVETMMASAVAIDFAVKVDGVGTKASTVVAGSAAVKASMVVAFGAATDSMAEQVFVAVPVAADSTAEAVVASMEAAVEADSTEEAGAVPTAVGVAALTVAVTASR
jgi:predicted phosphoribosyltransferase